MQLGMRKNNLLNQKIGLKLSIIGNMSRVFAIQAFAAQKFCITPEQFSVLAVLLENDGAYQRQIAFLTFKDRPNITRIINILEKENLVKSHQDVQKRKVYKILITEKGKQIYEKVLPTVLEVWEKTVDGISDSEIETCLNTLEKIQENLRNNVEIQM